MHWAKLFPCIGARSSFVKQAENLWWVKQKIHERLIYEMGSSVAEKQHIIDGFPMKLCHFRRAKNYKLFNDIESATYGFCASKNERYYGFAGTVVITEDGLIIGYTVTKPNIEREASFECVENISGDLLGDKGYSGEEYKSCMLSEQGITMIVPPKKNQRDTFCNKERKKIK